MPIAEPATPKDALIEGSVVAQDSSRPLSAKRIPELDGIRGVAIFLILLWHFVGHPLKPTDAAALSPLWRMLGITWSGVDLFFVLSGFLIGGILLDERKSQNYFKTFYIRRACRIFPLYYLLLLSFFAADLVGLGQKSHELAWLFNNPMPGWSYLTFTQNILMTLKSTFGSGWLAMTWSLAIEEQFYLLLPLLIRFVPGKRLTWVLLAGVILAPLIRCALLYFERREALGAGYVMMPCRADALLLGVLGAYAVRVPRICELLSKHRTKVYVVFAVLLAGVVGIAYYSPHFISIEVTRWGRTWFALFYVVLLMIAVVYKDSLLAALMRSAWLRGLGLISYSLYLVHQIVLSLTLAFLFPNIGRTGLVMLLPTLVAFVLALAVSAALYQSVEKPFMRFGHKFRYA
jgi:peptidoglycan/LPS O-acetylase OafA/YrhL